MIFTKYIDRKVHVYIDYQEETISSLAWDIRASYHFTLGYTPGQAVLGRDMLFKTTSLIDWHVVTTRKKRQVDIDNAHKNTRQMRHDYEVGNLAYMEKTSIYRILYYKKHGLYIITELFTSGTVRVQRGATTPKTYEKNFKLWHPILTLGIIF